MFLFSNGKSEISFTVNLYHTLLFQDAYCASNNWPIIDVHNLKSQIDKKIQLGIFNLIVSQVELLIDKD